MNTTKIEQKILKTKYFNKAIMITKKIPFSTQIDQATGELLNKEFQATIYVPDGQKSPYLPKIGLSLKLGNSNMALYVDDMQELERSLDLLMVFICQNKTKVNDVLIVARNDFNKSQKLKLSEIKDAEQEKTIKTNKTNKRS